MTDADDVSNYEHLWANAHGPYALLHLNPGKDEVPRYMVVNLSNRIALVIEDNEVAEKVTQRMLTAGVPVVWVGNGF